MTAVGVFTVASIITGVLNAIPLLGGVTGAFVVFYAQIVAAYLWADGFTDATGQTGQPTPGGADSGGVEFYTTNRPVGLPDAVRPRLPSPEEAVVWTRTITMSYPFEVDIAVERYLSDRAYELSNATLSRYSCSTRGTTP